MKKRILLLTIYCVFVVLFFLLDLHRYISFETLKIHREELILFVKEHSLLAAFSYILLYATLVSLSVPGGTVMTLTGGFLFGALWGTLYTISAATLGATGIFFLVQTTIGKPLRDRAGPWLAKMSTGFQKNAFNYLLVLRLIPLFPFFVVNLVPGLLGVSARTYIVATAIGIVPGTYIITLFGTGIGQIIDSGNEISTKDILSPEIITALVGAGVLSLLPVLYRRYKKKL